MRRRIRALGKENRIIILNYFCAGFGRLLCTAPPNDRVKYRKYTQPPLLIIVASIHVLADSHFDKRAVGIILWAVIIRLIIRCISRIAIIRAIEVCGL